MLNGSGSNMTSIKQHNQALVLKLIASNPGLSRIGIARISQLSKMTVSNVVAHLIESDIVEELGKAHSETSNGSGRNPTILKLSDKSPCICGVSLNREVCHIALGDLSGKVFDDVVYDSSDELTEDRLLGMIADGITQLGKRTSRKIIAIGVSCIGPISSVAGMLLNPTNFHGIEHVPIISFIEKQTGLPAFLLNDSNAGALAEKMYGQGKAIPNFVYLHIRRGIGSGFILENELYSGNNGQSGEIGHSTINFSGSLCECGNTGCLELYANIVSVRLHLDYMAAFHPKSRIKDVLKPTIADVINAANKNDMLAVSALGEYCGYLASALVTTMNMLDISYIILDYNALGKGNAFEAILNKKISSLLSPQRSSLVNIVRSTFKGKAPLIGAIALVADKVFKNQLSLE
jgi:predicted NBD/HSP70 family sugar kinase